MLILFLLIPLLAALAISIGSPAYKTALIATGTNLGLGLITLATYQKSIWELSLPVLQYPSISLSFGFLGGINLLLLLLSLIVTFSAVLIGNAKPENYRLYYNSILLISTGAIGTFLSTDLISLYLFHELALIPSFLMIGLLGRGNNQRHAWRMTIYLVFGSMVLLAGLLWLASQTAYQFDLKTLLSNLESLEIARSHQIGIAGLLIVGFGTLISLFPFHSWAAPAYASAPTPVSMLHAGVLKKFGIYGLVFLTYPLVPEGFEFWLKPLIILSLANLLWIGYITLNQSSLDRLLGYSSVMHIGYLFLGFGTLIASQGENPFSSPAIGILVLAHGLSIALLFLLIDCIEKRTNSLTCSELGGIAKPAPKLAFLFGAAVMASIGLPGFGNFVGELLVFLSGFHLWNQDTAFGLIQIATILAIWAVVLSAIIGLRVLRSTLFGETNSLTTSIKDLGKRELLSAYLLLIPLLLIGVFPNLVLSILK